MYDGTVTIGFKGDTKQLEKDINNAERKLQQYERETKKLTEKKAKIEIDVSNYEAAIELIKKRYDENLKFASTEEGVNRILKEEEEELKVINAAYEVSKEELNDINKQIKENTNGQEIQKQKIQELNKELRKTKGFENIKDSIENVGKSINKITKKIVGWGLAIFGIRQAFSFIRNAINTIAGDDEQLKADIDYMKNAIAYAIEPLVRSIVNLAKQLMFYIGYIIKAWTGANIFENADKSLKNATGNAKKLNKELDKTVASFDEANILQDKGTSGESGTTTPSFSFKDIENLPVPEWIDWIAKNGDKVAAILSGIATGLIAVKLGFSGIQALGIGIAVASLVALISDIQKFVKKPTLKNFLNILRDIAGVVGGIAIAFGNWPVAIGAAIALIIVELVKHFDDIKGFFNGLIRWISTDFTNMLVEATGPFGHLIAAPIEGAIRFISDLFEGLVGGVRKVIDGIVKMFRGDFLGGIKEVFSGLFDILKAPFQATYDFVESIFKGIVNFIIGVINEVIDAVNSISFTIPDWVPGLGGKKIGFNLKKIPLVGEKTTGGGGGGFRGAGGSSSLISLADLPSLTVGSIINQPTSGIPSGSSYSSIGEQKAESMVESIAKNINITLTNITKLDSREISRKVDKVQKNDDFVFNR